MAPRIRICSIVGRLFSHYQICLFTMTRQRLRVFPLQLLRQRAVTTIKIRGRFFHVFRYSVCFHISVFSFLHFTFIPPREISTSISSVPFPERPYKRHPRYYQWTSYPRASQQFCPTDQGIQAQNALLQWILRYSVPARYPLQNFTGDH